MAISYNKFDVVNAVAHGSKLLSERKEEVNRLNVFPVPDGDTGTNMSLTLESVVEHLSNLPIGASSQDARNAIANGALMGARGNSGVITSQILRGMCEGSEGFDDFDLDCLDSCFSRAEEVAFQAVRKPVEGTILTVLHDCASACHYAKKKRMSLDDALKHVAKEAFESVERTPEFLPVLKENNVVDAGGFGLAIFIGGMVESLTGQEGIANESLSFARKQAPKVEIEQINDWAGSKYRYCNEFLVDSDVLDPNDALEFLASLGDCELCVGAIPKFKVHVHSNTPDKVLAYFLERGQISEVFIHNMQLQSEQRSDKLAAEQQSAHKALGFVAVCVGEGNANILRSLGVDVVVSGGQTMNPSTKDLYDAAMSVNADAVIILPNNSNIIMAAQSAAELLTKPCAVVPTKSLPAAFTALFSANQEQSLEANVCAMTEALDDIQTAEVTTAIKDSRDAHDNPIANGDIIGICDGAIEAVGSSISGVVMDLLAFMHADDADTITLLAGEDLSEEDFDALKEQIEDAYDNLDVDAHRGGQPLYPIIFGLE